MNINLLLDLLEILLFVEKQDIVKGWGADKKSHGFIGGFEGICCMLLN